MANLSQYSEFCLKRIRCSNMSNMKSLSTIKVLTTLCSTLDEAWSALVLIRGVTVHCGMIFHGDMHRETERLFTVSRQ